MMEMQPDLLTSAYHLKQHSIMFVCFLPENNFYKLYDVRLTYNVVNGALLSVSMALDALGITLVLNGVKNVILRGINKAQQRTSSSLLKPLSICGLSPKRIQKLSAAQDITIGPLCLLTRTRSEVAVMLF